MIGQALVVAGGGSAGAVARFVADGAVSARSRHPFPVATLLINVLGSLLLGVLYGLVMFHDLADELRLVLGTGFCGGFTTFSTASFSSVRLFQEGRSRLAALNVFATLILATTAASVGLALASL